VQSIDRGVCWGVAVAIDYAGPAWLTRERLRGLQQVAVAHFSER
jgi:low temperature requirement protein LtrA